MSKKDRSFKYKQLREETSQAKRISRENTLEMNKPRKVIHPSFKAEFDGGECPRCFVSISKGDTVRYDENDELVHVSHKAKEEVFVICDSCFLTKPCECED